MSGGASVAGTGSLEDRREEFLAAHPAYAATAVLDGLRASEFSRLDAAGHVYLDYTGSGLYAASLIRQHGELLLDSVLGNPHSANPASVRSTELLEGCRERLLTFFRADPEEYVAIFTANASHALKLVGEAYPFESGDRFLLTFDNHNSVNGIREFDRVRGAETLYIPLAAPELRADEEVVRHFLAKGRHRRHDLFAYPAQSNFSGVQHPLEWIGLAQERGWDVLLDAAAFVPTNRLDLSRWHPDFVALSFYKMFGYPTGVGALLARRDALARLHRPWFAGGTIEVASVQADRFIRTAGAAGFEDGTPDFANVAAVSLGLDLVDSIGIEVIHARVQCLTGWLIDALLGLRHASGTPLVRLYGPADTRARGGTITFNFHDPQGRLIDHLEVERRAAQRGISLRTGCFCNPGAGELAMGLVREELEACFQATGSRLRYDDLRRCVDPKGAGAIRVSLGLASNFDDVCTFADFAGTFVQ